MPAQNELWIIDLGLRPYAEALVIQREVARRRISGEVPEDVLLLVEHPPVITLGRSAKGQHLLASPGLLQARGVELFEVERGGDVTFHGPGQLVGYPIIDLKRHRKDLHWFLRQVEEALIQALATYGVPAGRVEKYTGVWVGRPHPEGAERPRDLASRQGGLSQAIIPSGARDLASRQGGPAQPVIPSAARDLASRQGGPDWQRKIASIGVHARDWVTWHGFALNVSTDLSFFDLMVPCGIAEVTMTSLGNELRAAGAPAPSLADVGTRVATAFGALFDLSPAGRPESALGAPQAPAWTLGTAGG
ncbi:MAG: lipoyl(octanoyl) transferase LipB [Gemmatimonadaceae bacterium]